MVWARAEALRSEMVWHSSTPTERQAEETKAVDALEGVVRIYEIEPDIRYAKPRLESAREVDLLSLSIDSKAPELALMTPERQRLAILAWICRARALAPSSKLSESNHGRREHGGNERPGARGSFQ